MHTGQIKGPYYGDLLKRCKQCERLYGPGKRGLTQFLESMYCSSECTGLSQRNSMENLKKQIQIDEATGCHNWMGTRNHQGYGQVTWHNRCRVVHRLIWESLFGPVAGNLQIDHICRNRSCCNPEHLRVVTPQENVLASTGPAANAARREACPKCGSAYSLWEKTGNRYCKTCRNAGLRAWYERNKEDIQAQRKAKKLKKSQKE